MGGKVKVVRSELASVAGNTYKTERQHSVCKQREGRVASVIYSTSNRSVSLNRIQESTISVWHNLESSHT